ncbi:MAG: CHAD domain-containing protein [Thermosynechococcaceae cyanobacterium]
MDTVIVSPAQEEASSEPKQLTVREYALKSIQKNFHKSIKHKKDVLADQDPEGIHQMRVGMRRLRTALAVFADFVSLPSNLDREIAKLSKGLGSVRDLDVLGMWFSDYKTTSELNTEEEEHIAILLGQLDRQRKKQFKLMDRSLKGKRYLQFVEELQGWLDRPVFLPGAEWPIQWVLPDLLLPLINRFLLHPGWLATTSGNLENWTPTIDLSASAVNVYLAKYGSLLHDLRKQTKRVRYQTEFFLEFYDAYYNEQTHEFRSIQDLLGQLQDSQVLNDFLTQKIGQDWNVQIPSLNLHFRQQRLDLWLQWQTIQQKYLKPDVRERLRLLVERPQASRQSV